MQIMSAMLIEEARDVLLKLDASYVQKQMNEIEVACGSGDDFNRGVLLGIETARVALAQDVKAIEAGVSL